LLQGQRTIMMSDEAYHSQEQSIPIIVAILS